MKKKEKKKMSKKKKIIIFILVLLVAAALVFVALKVGNKGEEKPQKTVVDQIKNFDYSVVDTDTELFKENFKELKNVLSKKEIDNKEYASVVSKLFIIDFYTLNNKTSINDIGSVQFVYSSYEKSAIMVLIKATKNGAEGLIVNKPLNITGRKTYKNIFN